MSSTDTSAFGTVPALGLGTWQNIDPERCVESVAAALGAGYRHIDTAQIYGTEGFVGRAIAESDVPREEITVATKLWYDGLGRDAVRHGTRASLARLGLDRIDLLYVHWPAGTYDPAETLGALAELRDDGLIAHVGVSNFTLELLDEARDAAGVPIVANQVEMHPLLQQERLREAVRGTQTTLVAYSPLVHGEVFEIEELVDIAAKHGVSEAQVCLAWLREKGVAAVPKATSPEHIRDNAASRDLALDPADVAAIDAIDRKKRISDASFAPDW